MKKIKTIETIIELNLIGAKPLSTIKGGSAKGIVIDDIAGI